LYAHSRRRRFDGRSPPNNRIGTTTTNVIDQTARSSTCTGGVVVSVQVMNLVWLVLSSAITSTQKLVLLCLASHGNDDGQNAYPSVQRLAGQTALTPRAVQKALRHLANNGFIVAVGVASRTRFGMRSSSNGSAATANHVRGQSPIANHVRNQRPATANHVHPCANLVHP
jgi:hypothetical protein